MRTLLIRALPLAAAAAAVAGFCALGIWQLQRAEEKAILLKRIDQAREASPRDIGSVTEIARLAEDSRGPVYVRARLGGRYLHERQFLLDNQIDDGRAGFEVLTPLTIDGGVVIVNRGWLPMGRDRSDLPAISVDGERRTVTGVLGPFPGAGIEVAPSTGGGWPRLVQYPDPADLRGMLDRPVAPLMLRLDPGTPDGYRRDWQPEIMGPRRHYGYAVQWFALALTVIVVTVVVELRRIRRQKAHREHDDA